MPQSSYGTGEDVHLPYSRDMLLFAVELSVLNQASGSFRNVDEIPYRALCVQSNSARK